LVLQGRDDKLKQDKTMEKADRIDLCVWLALLSSALFNGPLYFIEKAKEDSM